MDLPPNRASAPKDGARRHTANNQTQSLLSLSLTNNPTSGLANLSLDDDASSAPRATRLSPNRNRNSNGTDTPRGGTRNQHKRVRTTLKTLYCYRIAIRLPPAKLRQFPRKFETARVFSDDPNAAFVTLNIAQPLLHSLALRARTVSTTNSPPSLTSGSGSTPSGIDLHSLQRTPAASDLLPQVYLPGQSHEELLAAAGSSLALDPSRLFPCFGGAQGYHQPGASSSFTSQASSKKIRPSDTTMAPVKDTSSVHMTIKDVIQHLSEIQIQTHGYVPDTQDLLVDKMTDLAGSLSRLQNLTSPVVSPNNHIHQVQIAPEIVDYVDDGRNPDIFTRDFVENVQRGNAVINGKQQAFREFSEIYAKALKDGFPEMSKQVDRVMNNAGFDTEDKNEDDGAKPSSMNGPSAAEGGG